MSKYQFQVERSEINYLSVIIGSYDGMAIVKTVDQYKAVIEVIVAPGCATLIDELILYLKETEEIELNLLT